MNYSFNVTIANRVGVEKAVLIENIAFWIKKNMANRKNFYDGKYWTYNSSKAFHELFPFWNAKKIQRMLKSLEDEGILLSGNYNKSKYDQTKWYTINDDSIMDIYFLQCSEVSNEKSNNEQPIPDINTDINTDINIITHPAVIDRQEEEKELRRELKDSFYDQLPDKSMWDFPKEGMAIKRLVKKATCHNDPHEFLKRLILTFFALKEKGNTFWQSQPFLPSVLSSQGIYPRVVEQMNKGARQEQKACDQYDEMYEEVMCEST